MWSFFACSHRASASSGVTWCWRRRRADWSFTPLCVARMVRAYSLLPSIYCGCRGDDVLLRARGRGVPASGWAGCGWRAREWLVRLCLLTECAVNNGLLALSDQTLRRCVIPPTAIAQVQRLRVLVGPRPQTKLAACKALAFTLYSSRSSPRRARFEP